MVESVGTNTFTLKGRNGSPDTGRLGRADQLFEKHTADTLPASFAGYIDAIFDDACINAAARDGADRDPAEHLVAAKRDEAVGGQVGLVPGFLGRQLCLEGGDALPVDAGHRGPVSRR